jgi:hypothetical protein
MGAAMIVALILAIPVVLLPPAIFWFTNVERRLRSD